MTNRGLNAAVSRGLFALFAALNIATAEERISRFPEPWMNGIRLVSNDGDMCHGDASGGDTTSSTLGGCDSLIGSDCRWHGTLFRWSRAPDATGGPDINEPIVTDRPDFTEASTTVGRGVAQLEFGYTYAFDNGTTTTKSHSFPEALLRYGIFADWFELRAAWNYARSESDGVLATGAEDLYLGVKIGLTPQAGILPEMALVPQMTVPTGAASFTADEALPGVNWLYGWDLNDSISTAGSTQFNRTIDDNTGKAYTEWAQSWTVGLSLSERLGAYTEWFAFFPHAADTARPEHYLNGGFTYLITDDMQWDIRGGVGLNDAADDYFAGMGLSIRWK